jgi:sugar phosphate isomerase/epimerase
MIFGLTTRWNARRHETGEAMLEEILALGITRVELGFDLTPNLVPGVCAMAKAGRITVDSLHAYCPLPPIVPFPSPEPFTLASLDPSIRAHALHYLGNTIRFAGELGARVVVAHAGNVEMKLMTPRLLELAERPQGFDDAYEKLRMKLLLQREKAAGAQLALLYQGLERLLPLLDETGVILALELLPTWEALPTELEMERLLVHFSSPRLRYWHDLGHGQIRENLGLVSHLRWLTRLRPWLAGMHVHDVRGVAQDHVMPPGGAVAFPRFREVVQGDILRVLEPSGTATAEDVRRGLDTIRAAWEDAAPPAGDA